TVDPDRLDCTPPPNSVDRPPPLARCSSTSSTTRMLVMTRVICRANCMTCSLPVTARPTVIDARRPVSPASSGAFRQGEDQGKRRDTEPGACGHGEGGAVTKRQSNCVGAGWEVKGAEKEGADDRDPDRAANALHGADHAAGRARIFRIDGGDDEI